MDQNEPAQRESLQELEGIDWGDPAYDSTLVSSVHRARRIPISALSLADARLLITHGVGVRILVPLVLGVLESDPLAYSGHYEGDLLTSLFSVHPAYWLENPDRLERGQNICRRAIELTALAPAPETGILTKDIVSFLTRKPEAAGHLPSPISVFETWMANVNLVNRQLPKKSTSFRRRKK